jgi:hypothetical protein
MKKKINKNNTDYSLAHVLYQKLGTDWYAFTEVDGDCFMSKVEADAVDQDKIMAQSDDANRARRIKAA